MLRFFFIFFIIFNLFLMKSYADFLNAASELPNINNLDNFIFAHKDFDNYIAFGFMPSQFSMQELQTNSISTKIKLLENISFASNFSGIFNSLFNNYNFANSIIIDLSQSFTIGAQLEYLNYIVHDYNSNSRFYFNIAGNYFFNNFNVGFILKNLNRDYIINSNNSQQIAQFGLGYLFFDKFSLNFDAIINIDKNNSILVSTSYSIFEFCKLKIAYNSLPQNFEFATNFNIIDNFIINYNLFKNNYLGYNHHLGLMYLW